MGKRREMSICEGCGKEYQKCRFNKRYQKYCTRRRCVTRRRQERQRQYYRKKYRNNKNFADAERQRCRRGMQKRRKDASKKTAAEIPSENDRPVRIDMKLFATGLLSQWIDSKDPEEVEQAARRFEKRGQQLAIAALSVRGSPVLDIF